MKDVAKQACVKGMGVFNGKFHPGKMLRVGTGGIPYEEFLKINPKELF
ncbi:MAG: hypothetical protein LBU37_02965 [Tannerellaceae bacterium]|nr:hypothetical protein [Tannerellaceae bacterium]